MTLTPIEKNELIENMLNIIMNDYISCKRFVSLIKRLSKKYNYENANITHLIQIYTNSMNIHFRIYIDTEFDRMSDEEVIEEKNIITSNINSIFEDTSAEFIQELYIKLKSRYYTY